MNADEREAIQGRTLLLFDGLCGLCHGTVRFLMRRDQSKCLRYAPLQSLLGQEILAEAGAGSLRGNLDGVVLIEYALTPRQIVSTRSDAMAHTLLLLHGWWPLAGTMLRLIPRWLRELAYGFVARCRYRLFGAYEVCPLPSSGERAFILGVRN